MKSYEFTKVIISYFASFRMYSTDPKIITWFLDELKKIVPSYKLTDQKKDTEGNIFYIHVSKLSDKDLEIESHLVRYLCHNGWEPFSASENYEHSGTNIITHFRLEKNS